jgi:hypothetical protein
MNTDTQIQVNNNNLQTKETPIPRPLLVRNQNVCLDVNEKHLSKPYIHFYKSIQLEIPEIEKEK